MSPPRIAEPDTVCDTILKEINSVRKELYNIEAELNLIPTQEKKELYKYLAHVRDMLKSVKRA
ncbi:hypothetical protein GGH95_002159, partial [Coemansia sp. RSA 1836]